MQPEQALVATPDLFDRENIVSKTGELPAKVGPAVPKKFQPLPDEKLLHVAALRVEHYTVKQISDITGLDKGQVHYALAKARTLGKLVDIPTIMDTEAVPSAVENFLDAIRDPEHPQHWRATEKTLEGRGVLRRHERSGGGGGAHLPSLQVNIINPQGGDLPTVAVIQNSEKGSVIGAERLD